MLNVPDLDVELKRVKAITVTLDEADWRAFLAIQPQPVKWLRERIQELLAEAPQRRPVPPNGTV